MSRRAYTETQKYFRERCEETRRHLHDDLGWPWEEIWSVKSMFEAAERMYFSEPFARPQDQHRRTYLGLVFQPELFEGMGADAEIFQEQPHLLTRE